MASTLVGLCRLCIASNVSHYLHYKTLFYLPKRERQHLLSSVPLIELVQLIKSDEITLGFTNSEINSVWCNAYKKFWNDDNIIEEDPISNWRDYLLATLTKWLINRYTILHSCNSMSCTNGKFDYVLRVLFGFWPFETAHQSRLISNNEICYGAVVICKQCKLAVPVALSSRYDMLISLTVEKRVTNLMEILMEQFNYYPTFVRFDLRKSSAMNVYLKLEQFFVFEKFLSQIHMVEFSNMDMADERLVELLMRVATSGKDKLKVNLKTDNTTNDITVLQNVTKLLNVKLEIVRI